MALMDMDFDCLDEWLEEAVVQALALRETVRDQPDLRELADVILVNLGTKIGRLLKGSEPENKI